MRCLASRLVLVLSSCAVLGGALKLAKPKYGDEQGAYQEGTEENTTKNAMNDCADGLEVAPGTKDVSKSQATRILTSKVNAIMNADDTAGVSSEDLAAKEKQFNFKKRHAAQDAETDDAAPKKADSMATDDQPPFGKTPAIRKNWSGPNSPSSAAEDRSKAATEKGTTYIREHVDQFYGRGK